MPHDPQPKAHSPLQAMPKGCFAGPWPGNDNILSPAVQCRVGNHPLPKFESPKKCSKACSTGGQPYHSFRAWTVHIDWPYDACSRLCSLFPQGNSTSGLNTIALTSERSCMARSFMFDDLNWAQGRPVVAWHMMREREKSAHLEEPVGRPEDDSQPPRGSGFYKLAQAKKDSNQKKISC